MTCQTCTLEGLCTLRCYDRITKNGTNMQRSALYGSLMLNIDIREKLKKSLAKLKERAISAGERNETLPAINQMRDSIDRQILYVKNLACAKLLTGCVDKTQQSTVEIETSRKTFLTSDHTILYRQQPRIQKTKTRASQRKTVALKRHKQADITESTLNDAAKGLKPYKKKNDQSYAQTLANYKKLSAQGAI